MNFISDETIKPFASILILMSFLFILAFVKMENRRMSYVFLKLVSQEKQLINKQRKKRIQLAEMTGPERVRNLASKTSMKKAGKKQRIQMSVQGVAILQ